MPGGVRGAVTSALKYGLDHAGDPNALGQFAPKQLFGVGGETIAFATSLNAASTLSAICAEPLLTIAIPSLPTEAVMFVPSATSMKMLPCTGSTCTCPSRGLWSAMRFATSLALRDTGTVMLDVVAAPVSTARYSG